MQQGTQPTFLGGAQQAGCQVLLIFLIYSSNILYFLENFTASPRDTPMHVHSQQIFQNVSRMLVFGSQTLFFVIQDRLLYRNKPSP